MREDIFVVASRRLLYVGMFFLPLLRFKVTHGLNVSDAIFLASAIFLLLSRVPPPRAPGTPAWYFGTFIFLLAGVVASTQADAVAQSIIVVGNAIYLFIILQYLLRQQLFTRVYMRRALVAFVAGSTLSALVAILQVDFHVFVFHVVSSSIGGNSRAIGLSTQPNLAGISFATGIVFAVGLIISDRGQRRNRYLAGCVAVLVAALLLSGSVSGMGSTIVGLLVLFIARGTSLKTVLLVFLSLAAVYVLVFGVIDRGSHLDPITRIEKTTNANAGTGGGTLSLRLRTIETAWAEILQKPVTGHGLDQQTLAVYFDRPLFVYYPPHNTFVLYWYGGGIFMLFGVCIMMGSSFSRLLSGRRRQGKNRDPLRDVVLAGCAATLFFSLQGPAVVDRWLWLPFLLALCFRDPSPVEVAPTERLAAGRRDPGAAPPAPPATNGQPRRVRGVVGRHAAPERGRHVAPS